eukprot:CAMPEP_0198264340 /NCGR_PEP_ID=MMETSP1447-20131203/15304_1 /TAXON_ID=420782 /ORGANISM="Chaetoceros dichaeta, Strain CCMP1751" /LENGTH=182 /DNA_ID=CAMNT_0043953237 /DNA_START=95 /DNA_END=643 /DNA_ORIENTATION=+
MRNANLLPLLTIISTYKATFTDAFIVNSPVGSPEATTTKGPRLNFAISSSTVDDGEDVTADVECSRRSLFRKGATVSLLALGFDLFSNPNEAQAAQTDCITDCLKNCKLIAPKDPGYCNDNCSAYCAQEDRADGLSGSVSSTGGETGILGTGTVVKGEDKPPTFKLPGLDFNSEKGRKLIGY